MNSNPTKPVTAVLDRDAASGAAATPAPPNAATCPICSATGAKVWLQAPDRFHGRRTVYTLLRCPACSLVWLTDPPQPADMGAHYTDAYDRLISAAGEASPVQRWGFRKEAISKYKDSGSLLDLGCSSGAFLAFMRGPSWNLFGIEMSAESAQQAHEKTGASVFNGKVLDARFSPGSFDVITCFDVLEHLYEPRGVMARIAEWLKPGGIFYVLVPNIDSAEGRVFRSYWHGLEMPRHLFHYSPASLTCLAESAGLVPVSVETHRNPAVGTSLRYAWHDVCSFAGIRKTPVAYRREAHLPWRAARKIVRMTILRGLLAMAPWLGGGESIHAVFRKPDSDR
ncbi:MAG TPA: class I SAM-dependent methyltransferase [Acidobacteriaceae bacterium]